MLQLSKTTLKDVSDYNDRLATLLPQIQHMAKRYCGGQTGAAADELEADMIYAIIERQDKDSSFLSDQNNDSYILHFARYIPWAYINKQIAANKKLTYSLDNVYEAIPSGDDIEVEQSVDPNLMSVWDPTADLIRAEEALQVAEALGGLSKRENQVIAYTAKGYETGHIAEILEVSAPAICSYRSRAIKKIQAAVLH